MVSEAIHDDAESTHAGQTSAVQRAERTSQSRDVGSAELAPVRYISRTRDYYAAQGFERPYRWAHHREAPFAPLRGPLAKSRLVVITTANEARPEGCSAGEPGPPRRVHSFSSRELRSDDPECRFFTEDLSWHKEATHTDDLDSYLPIRALRALVSEGELGGLTERFHGVPTEYSQRRTVEADAPEILRRCREDHADVALLVPL